MEEILFDSTLSHILKDYVFFRHDGALKKLSINDIVVLEAADNYVKFFTEEGIFMVRVTMDDAVKALPATKFIRVSRVYAVSIKEISTINNEYLTIKGVKDQIPVSKSFYPEFLKKIKTLDESSSTKKKSAGKKNQSSKD